MEEAKQQLYTVEYIHSLPEDKRVELIDGVIYDMTAPLRVHQKIAYELGRQIGNAIEKNHGDCEVYPAPFAVQLDDYNYLEPDISLICDKSKLDDKGCNGAPELVMEVVSPSSIRRDYITKLNKYIDAGVFEYWIVDPVEKQILVYLRSNDYIPKTYKISDVISVGIIKDCKIKLDI